MKVVLIKTYLKNSDGVLVDFDQFQGGLGDTDYIDGAISLNINGVEIISTDMWDYVDELWGYIVKGVVKLAKKEASTTYFPDQPIKLSFEHLYGEVIKLSVECEGVTSAVLNQRELHDSLREHLYKVFEVMKKLAPENSEWYNEILHEVGSLQ